MHPTVAHEIAIEHIRELHAQAASRGLARCLRRYRHRAAAAGTAVFEPCAQPADVRLV